jgi:hypothetical protein
MLSLLPLLVALPILADAATTPAKLEQAAGWTSYTGDAAKSLWRGYKQPGFPTKGWAFDKRELNQTGPGGGDLITKEKFADVELTCQFKLAAKANSGIMWRVGETGAATWYTGPEYQLLDDLGYSEPLHKGQLTAALYELYEPAADKTLHPVGEWNEARIRLRNGVIQHWLNGKKIVEGRIYEESEKPTDGKTAPTPTGEWKSKIAASKFKEYPGYGILPTGHIALQDHGGGISFRDIKIRDLAAAIKGETVLFNGKDLTGWKAIVPDAAKANMKPEGVWSVKDGILICKGNPVGYIRTEKDYKNYILRVEWRFNPVTKQAGNSGVLVRMVGEDKVWPKSVEAQLQSGQAGDFWNIGDFKMTAAKDRTNGRNTKRTHTAERPVGEWNEYEIIVNHGEIILKVNGEEVNRAMDVDEVGGKICLQSEGAEIQFRRITLGDLD